MIGQTESSRDQILDVLVSPELDSSFLVSVIVVAAPSFKGYDHKITEIASFLKERYAFFEILLIGSEAEENIEGLVETIGRIAPQIRFLEVEGNEDFDRLAMQGYAECIGDIVVLASVDELPFVDLPALLDRLRSGESLVRFRRKHGVAFERCSSIVVHWITGLDVDTRFFRTLGLNRQLLSELLGRPGELHLFRFTAHRLFGPQKFIEVDQPQVRRGLDLVLNRIDLVARLIATSAPRLLRFASALCATLAVTALISFIYVFGVWLFKKDVAEGWTSLI
jgi:hypothetical protein